MKIQHVVAAALLSALPLSAAAQTLKPGLWEVTNRMQGNAEMDKSMAQMQKEMAAMSPEQRKMVEEMMGRQGPRMGAGGTSARMCMTKEMVERNEIPSERSDCKTTSQARTGNTMKFAFACTNPPSSGEGQFTFVSAEAYTSRMAITSGAP